MASFKFDETLGAALIGFAVSCTVFGILSTQCWNYFRKYPMDRGAYKALVTGIWFAELVDQAFIGHVVYFYTVSNYANPLTLAIGDVPWTLIAQILAGNVVGVVVKGCFAMRVWRFSNRNIPVTGLIVLLTMAQFGFAIAYSVRAFQLNKLIYASRLKLVASLSLGTGALTDVITALALAYFLRSLRTGYKHSDTLVNSLTIYAINTGALTSAVSLSTLVLYDINPMNFEFLAFYFVLSKLYANSLLCTLNTRKTVRGRGTDRQGGTTSNTYGNTFQVSHHLRTAGRPPPSSIYQTKSQLEIGIHQEISVVSDTDSPHDYSQASAYPLQDVGNGGQTSPWR